MSTRPEWPITFFDEDYLKIYRPQLTEERTRAETEFIAGALDLPAELGPRGRRGQLAADHAHHVREAGLEAALRVDDVVAIVEGGLDDGDLRDIHHDAREPGRLESAG